MRNKSKSNLSAFKILIVTGIILLSSSHLMNTFSLDTSDFARNDSENDFVDYGNGWNADEDQFMRGLSGPKPERYFETTEKNRPITSYVSSYHAPEVVHLLVILVQFSDFSASESKTAIENKIFSNSSSVKDYYLENSYGKIELRGNTTNWLTLPNTRVFYGADNGTNTDSLNQGLFQTFTDIIDLADPYVNYGLYNLVMIVHAGNDQAQGYSDDDLWSVAYFPTYGPLWYRDNVEIVSASMVAELENIGVYCHEFAHQLNVPDLYDVTDSGINYINSWGLMASGAWNGASGTSPAHVMGWSKNFLGLITEENIRIVNDYDVVLVTVDDLETGGNNFTLIKLPLSDEDNYYLVEARFQTDYDTYLPDYGLIITKINETRQSGHGIVDLMDSRSFSITKNDGEYDVSSSSEYGAFHDNINEIHIIIKERTSDSFTILIDRAVNWTSTTDYLLAQYYLEWNLTNMSKGQIIAWEWKDHLGGSSILSSRVKWNSSFAEYSDYVNHDSGVFRIETSGDYLFDIVNEHLSLGTNLEYELVLYTPPSLKFYSSIVSSGPIYKTNQFELTVTVQNEGGSSEGPILLIPNLPIGLSLAPGETLERNRRELGYLDIFTESWQLIATNVGNFSIDIQCFTEYEGFLQKNQDVEVVVDNISPIITINNLQNNYVIGATAPQFDISIEEPNLNMTWYSLNGGINITFTGLTGSINQALWDTLPEGNVITRFYAKDLAGNIGFVEITIKKDISAPIISIISPNMNDSFEVVPSYEIVITEVNLDKIWYSFDDGLNTVFITELIGIMDFTLWDQLSNGYITMRFYANDTLGNTSFDEVIVVKNTPNLSNSPRGIVGYNLFLLIGIICVVSVIIIKKGNKCNRY